MSFEELRNTRIQKMKLLEKAGMNPYPAVSRKDHSLKDVISDFDKLSKKDGMHLAGRILSIRGQGGLIFFNINDGTGSFQGLLKKDEMDEKAFDLFQSTVDIGDFVEINGKLFITKRGEKTLQVEGWKMLAKSLRPLPEKWHGLADEDEKFRKRYLDIIFNDDVRDMVEKRSKFFRSIRSFLDKKGFLEVDTPVLENTAGGAEARPFTTHYNAYDIEVYLRISLELWLKRLMVAGFPKVYEIGRVFRNEGADAEHLQDYNLVEFYESYSDYNKGMKFVEEMYKYIAEETFGTLKFKVRGFDIDLGGKWKTYDFVETVKKMTGIDILKTNIKEVEKKLQDLKVEYDRKGFNLNRAIDTLWKYCRRQIGGPGFLINVPVSMEPLAKRMDSNKELVERFQVILAGSEMGKGFSELNDPLDQMERFNDQAKLRKEGDEEAQMMDGEFVEALEYGMPPTFGFGLSERLFSFLMDKPVRECQIFPFMRPKG
ncbi:MAG: lysine--tRNA ligase [Candidatus Paceibacterota bacterium]|jgi:lysyl-tRNA synthetase class 2